MDNSIYESLSALMDNEANELELQRLLAQGTGDASVRQTWVRYHLAQQALHGHAIAHRDWDVSAAVQAALAGSKIGGAGAQGVSLKQRLLRPLQSFAVAASVAATVVIGGQQLARIEGADPYGVDRSVANNPSPVGMLNSLGATAVQASYGTQPLPVLQPATGTAYQELAQQRLRKYMQAHAEQASLNSPQGLVPFARVPQITQ